MRILGGGVVSILSLIFFGLIPKIVHFLIWMRLIPDTTEFREDFIAQTLVIVTLFVFLYILYWFISSILISWMLSIEIGYRQKLKKAKLTSKKIYGVDFLYFTFMDQKYQDNFWLDKQNYPWKVVKYFEAKNNLRGAEHAEGEGELENYINDKFHEYRIALGLPIINI